MDMTTYMQTPKGIYWDVVDGEAVALKTIDEAREYLTDMDKIGRLKGELETMDYYTNKWVEGVLSESDWNNVKSKRAEIRAKINEIEEKYS